MMAVEVGGGQEADGRGKALKVLHPFAAPGLRSPVTISASVRRCSATRSRSISSTKRAAETKLMA
ncbi:MAG: hypothetical protein IE886_00385 [Campylobacterales bacterium]|nr:hypothetical protein [Campylobacterales bacterium]